MKISIALILALIVGILSVSAIQADAPPIVVDEAFAYRHITEDISGINKEDVLILVRYHLIADGTDMEDTGDPPLFTPADWDDLWDEDNDGAARPDILGVGDRYLTPVDVILRLETAAGGLLLTTNPPRLGQSIAAFYLEEGTLPFVWNDALNLVLIGNPSTIGASGTESGSKPLDWRDTASQTITAEELANSLIGLMTNLELEHIDYEPGDLLNAGEINLVGRNLLLEAFPLMDAVAPAAFTFSIETLGEDFDPGIDQLQALIDASNGPTIPDALTNFADVFNTSALFLGIVVAFLLAVPVGYIGMKASGKGSYGLFAITGMLMWATVSSVMPVVLLLIIASIFFVAGAVWVAKHAPF